MKGSCPRITLLGSNSGKNLGDAAIMAAILDALSKELPTAEFYVPSTNPSFTDKHYGDRYNVKGVNVMPWTGSVRLFGIPTMFCMAKSDCALICDGIIFGKKFFNPLFNFLITLVFLVPWAKLVNCKIVCYSCGIGPFPGYWSRLAARYVINASDVVIMREHDSEKLARELGVTKPIEVTGDAAFINEVSSEERAKEIAAAEGLDWNQKWFGINVTRYVDSWLRPEERVSDKSAFLDTLAEGILKAQEKVSDPFTPVLFCTHPMDLEFCEALARKLSSVVIHNNTYLSHDIQAVMRKCELFMGMRFHSAVLATAVEAPLVGLIYAPKVRGFMRLLDCEEYSLELASIDADNLAATLTRSWGERQALREKQKRIVDELKAGAQKAANTVATRYYPEQKTATNLESANPQAANA